MTMSSPFTITLTVLDESVLRARARSSTAPHRDVIRARIVLAAADGAANTETPRGPLRTRGSTASGCAGPACRADGGAQPVRRAGGCSGSGEVRRAVSSAELASEAISREIAETISAATVRRWLAADAIKPWQHRSCIFPRDPDFQTKAARVLDLYARHWQGHPLGPDDYVISADEKSQLQALQRRHRGQPPGPGEPPCRVRPSAALVQKWYLELP